MCMGSTRRDFAICTAQVKSFGQYWKNFCMWYCLGEEFWAVLEEILHLVLLLECDLSSTEKDFSFSTASGL